VAAVTAARAVTTARLSDRRRIKASTPAKASERRLTEQTRLSSPVFARRIGPTLGVRHGRTFAPYRRFHDDAKRFSIMRTQELNRMSGPEADFGSSKLRRLLDFPAIVAMKWTPVIRSFAGRLQSPRQAPDSRHRRRNAQAPFLAYGVVKFERCFDRSLTTPHGI
jgi:hypothetical protein